MSLLHEVVVSSELDSRKLKHQKPAGLGTPHNYEDLSNKDLRKNAYTKAELRQTNFSGSDLSGVSLFGALAKGANFQGAMLRATDLESCDLEDADFTNAVLEGAQVTWDTL